MAKLKNRKAYIAIMISVISIIIAFTLVLNILATTVFDEVLRIFFKSSASSTSGDTGGVETTYVESAYNSKEELYEAESALCEQIAAEGITLLKNEGGLLPLAKNTTLSLFSHSSVDLIYGGTGSGTSSSASANMSLKAAIENVKLKVNDTLWKFYESGNGSSYVRGVGSVNYGAGKPDWKINECPWSKIAAESGLTATFNGTIAVYVLSRTGGEGNDLPTVMNLDGGSADKHYLELDDTEKEIIQKLNEQFSDVIIIVNTNNAMELGWINDYKNIKAVLNVPGMGATGLNGLADILVGNVSPSGHLTDTFVYDNFSSPAIQNAGDFKFSNANYYYVAYNEGIYVGYKYYETRYEDAVLGQGNTAGYNYSNEVLFPFGYGQTYADFEWSDFNTVENDNGTISVSVKVTNNGESKGKEVVQIYAQSPYTDYDKEYGIEKSAVELVGFAKTRELEKEDSQIVTVTFDKNDLKSYDTTKNHDGVKGAYVLEAGDYYITAANNAHSAVNNILAVKGKTVDDGMTANGNSAFVETLTFSEVVYSKDNDTIIQNQFDHATLDDVTYLSRSNWKDTYPVPYKTEEGGASRYGAAGSGKLYARQADSALVAKLRSTDSLNPTEKTAYTVMPETDAANGIEAIDLRGLNFDDPKWDELLKNLNLSELKKLVSLCAYGNQGLDSVKKPKLEDLDGPAGLNRSVMMGTINDVWPAWPTAYLLASTWNEELATAMGEFVGEDGLNNKVSGWYAPAMNIHRTPFSGRNYEYYSEDDCLSGIMGAATVRGAASKGMYAFIKHFALNDQETNRGGVSTWANEQSIRELYLKPFEMCVKTHDTTIKYNEAQYDANGNLTGYEMKTAQIPSCTALMTSYNRIGATWSGGDYNLITNVLRKEWGFKGFVITDFDSYDHMNTDQMLAAGGDAKMNNVANKKTSVESNANYAHYAVQAAKHILYCTVNSAGMNGYVHGVSQVLGFPNYGYMLIAWDLLAVAGVSVIVFFMIRKLKIK